MTTEPSTPVTDPRDTRIAELEQRLAHSERRRDIAAALTPHRPLDHELATVAIEGRLAHAQASGLKPSVPDAVAELVKTKPFLFAPAASGAPPLAAVTASHHDDRTSPTPSDRAADAARASGDRTSVLRYLRAKREA